MNKLIKAVSAFALAFVIASCGGEDPKADYKKLIDWNQQQAVKQAQIVAEFQQSLNAAQDSEEAIKIINTYESQANQIVESLDKIEIKSKEIKELKEKSKNLLKLSIELTVAGSKAKINSLSENEAVELENKLTELQNTFNEFSALDNALQKKYGEQPTQ